MRKLRMDLDALSVETFEIDRAEPVRGTVQGHWSQVGTCDAVVATCQVNGTCAFTCGVRCGSGTCT